MQALAHDFAREQMLPHAAKWDEQKTFPVEVMKEAAKLGFAGRNGWECSPNTGSVPLQYACSTVQQYRAEHHSRCILLLPAMCCSAPAMVW
jgi:alkylation response protein AidB-like acyl-CoA dehydrogenase